MPTSSRFSLGFDHPQGGVRRYLWGLVAAVVPVEMAGGARLEYDDSGTTFYYFLLSFYFLVLIPATYFILPKKKKGGVSDIAERVVSQ